MMSIRSYRFWLPFALLAFVASACGDDGGDDGGNGAVPSVTVRDQTPNPTNRVVVEQVVTAGGGFIAIHEQQNGGIGGVIGASAYLADGASSNVAVMLDRNVVNGETLYAMLHADGDANMVYGFPEVMADGPVLDAAGAIIAPPFRVTVEVPAGPSVVVGNQTADPPDEVVVATVNNDQPGFIVIHEQANGTFGAGIGISALLPAGRSSNVRISLGRSVVEGETLYAMLHNDGNGNGTYDDETTDPPVTDANGIIAPSFVVSLEEGDLSTVTVDSQIVNPTTRVVIREVKNVRGGFIAVHTADANNQVGPTVIGVSAYLPPGTNSEVVVNLDQAVEDGQVLFAMLHFDADGDMQYRFPNGPDGPEVDVNGALISPPFVTFVNDPVAQVVVFDQVANPPNQVNVLLAVAEEPGFVVIHRNDNGNFGAVAGVSSALRQGLNSNITITLGAPANTGAIYYAMLHADGNGNGAYDDEVTDPPVFDGENQIIAPPFVVTVNLPPEVVVQPQTADPANRVVIDRVVYTSGDGFIVIHEQVSGGIGEVIGASDVLRPGVSENVEVILDRNADDGETLYAMLHADGNDNGVYDDAVVDPPISDANGVIAPPFVVTVGTDVTVVDQVAGGGNNSVVVAEVIYNSGGFIAIHAANASGDIGAVIGVSEFLPAGTNTAVQVTLDRAVNNNETLFAMLHADVDNDQIYSFPGPDVPVLDGEGLVIAPPFSVTRQ